MHFWPEGPVLGPVGNEPLPGITAKGDGKYTKNLLINNKIPLNIIERLKFFKEQQKKNIHFVSKWHPINLVDLNLWIPNSKVLSEYLEYSKEYHILITSRNLWDSYISLEFKVQTNHKFERRLWDGKFSGLREGKHEEQIPDFKLDISKEKINRYLFYTVQAIEVEKQIKENLTYTTYTFEDILTLKRHHQQQGTIPLNIDYEKYIDNFHYYKSYFKMHEHDLLLQWKTKKLDSEK